MTHPKIKIAGSFLAVALGVVLGWLSLEWLLDAVEGSETRLVAEHLGQKLLVQLKFALLSALVGLSAFVGSLIGRRWNLVGRVLFLSLLAISAQWAAAAFKAMQLSAVAPEGTVDMPAVVYLGSLGTEWVPIAALAVVWVAVVPLLFGKKKSDALSSIPPVAESVSSDEDASTADGATEDGAIVSPEDSDIDPHRPQ
jgi:hypothetical protein